MIAAQRACGCCKLVNALLDFSRIEAGRVQADYEPADLAALTAELASVFRSAMREGRAGARRRLPARWPSRSTSTARCGRRSSSTCCPTPSSSPSRAGSRSHCGADGDGAVELSVRDTGVGIPRRGAAAAVRALPPGRASARARIARGQRHRPGPGAGARRLHGGEIAAESAAGEGTVLHASVPLLATGTCPAMASRDDRATGRRRRRRSWRRRCAGCRPDVPRRWPVSTPRPGLRPRRRRQRRHARVPRPAAGRRGTPSRTVGDGAAALAS